MREMPRFVQGKGTLYLLQQPKHRRKEWLNEINWNTFKIKYIIYTIHTFLLYRYDHDG